MSVIGIFRNVKIQTELLLPLATFIQPNRQVWGNVNIPNKRGRSRPNRHWDPKNKGLRKAKFFQIDLPDIDEDRKLQKTRDILEMRELMKRRGQLPTRPGREYPVAPTCMSDVIDRYIPQEENFGKSPLFSVKGAKDAAINPVKTKGKTMRSTRYIRKFESDFDPKEFAGNEAQKVYIDAHKKLSERKMNALHDLVTEDFYPKLTNNLERTTLYWEFVKSLEPPQVVHVRHGELLVADNAFAQVTVRFFTKQILAVYDRFGRLIHGHPHVAKDVLEFVVFERHIANVYGKWRMHAKLYPEWLHEKQERPQGFLTHVLDKDDIRIVQNSAEDLKDTENEDESKDGDGIMDEFAEFKEKYEKKEK